MGLRCQVLLCFFCFELIGVRRLLGLRLLLLPPDLLQLLQLSVSTVPLGGELLLLFGVISNVWVRCRKTQFGLQFSLPSRLSYRVSSSTASSSDLAFQATSRCRSNSLLSGSFHQLPFMVPD